jgi:hypothetical protein
MRDEKKQFKDTPSDQARRWGLEFAAARNTPWKKYKEQGRKVVHRFLDDKRGEDISVGELQSKLNLFHSNVIILQSMLYGKLPKVEVDRTFSDAEDDEARVAAVILERMLNQDIQAAGEDYATVLRSALQDRLLPGQGSARIRYDYKGDTVQHEAIENEDGEEQAPAYEEESIEEEWVETIYVHWQDKLWSPARTYSELRWQAYRSFLNYDELVKRFGEDVAKKLPSKPAASTKADRDGGEDKEVECQTEVWEIWDKSKKEVHWFVEGYEETLDKQPDPLELPGFWPEPPPMTANLTTTRYMPRADFALAQDLYNEIDKLQTRISILTDACKSIGFYDKQNAGIKRAMEEGVENDLIPVDNWAMYAEKGGAKGVVDWVPLENVATTIATLTEQLNLKIQQLYQITGMSDIMRGASQPYEAAATSNAKVQFASIRVQAIQEDFARFASDLQAMKVHMIQTVFQPYCIKEQSNIMYTTDGQDEALVDRAIALIKDQKRAKWRVTVRPESLALADYAQLKQDRTEYINTLALFMQSAAPLAEMDKDITPFLLELLKWGLSGFKGSNEIEGVMDRAIKQFTDKAKAPPPPPPPDPAVEKAKLEMENSKQEHAQKMEQQQQKFQMEQQEMQQNFQLEMTKMNQEIKQDQQKFMLEMKSLVMEMGFKKQTLQAEAEAQAVEQQTQFVYNTAEKEHEAAVDMESGEQELRRDKQREAAKQKPSNNGRSA